MGLLQCCVLVMIFTIVSTNALPGKENATKIKGIDNELDRRLAQRAFMKFSPHQRDACTVFCSERSNAIDASKLTDWILNNLRGVITQAEMDWIDIPPFQDDSFKILSGWAGKTSSIARKGNTAVTLDSTSVMLRTTLALEILKVGMKWYKVIVFPLRGDILADAHGSAISASIGFKYTGGECRVVLGDLTLAELGPLNVKVTGAGLFNGMVASKVKTYVLGNINDLIGMLRNTLTNVLAGLKCPF